MRTRKFFHTISAAAGGNYVLPTAMYSSFGDITKENVLALAKAAADTTGLKYEIVVTEYSGCIFFGLNKAN
jgi:hypothetical protein